MSRRGCSLPANASGFDTHRASISSRCGQELSELDVELVLALLRCCGWKIRVDDPVSLQGIVSTVASRHQTQAKATAPRGGSAEGAKPASTEPESQPSASASSTLRRQVMLDMIGDLKANRDRAGFGFSALGSEKARRLLEWVNSKAPDGRAGAGKGGGGGGAGGAGRRRSSISECTLPLRWEMLVADASVKTGVWWLESLEAMRRRIAVSVQLQTSAHQWRRSAAIVTDSSTRWLGMMGWRRSRRGGPSSPAAAPPRRCERTAWRSLPHRCVGRC
eukprot:COSAG01_NODE_1554_length_9930_cov_19.371478_6_plen_276_part_00